MSDSQHQFVAHILRRTSFSVSRDKINALIALDREQIISKLVDNAVPSNFSIKPILKNREDKSYPDFQVLLKTELQRLSKPKSGLADRMLWFWHGLITTSFEKVDFPGLIWRQHKLMAKHALGSFREMLIEISTDPAMLIYLDGEDSNSADPNENYARELLELFSMGRGTYTQVDVAAVAKALSGWYLDGIPGNPKRQYNPSKVKARYSAEDGLQHPVTFLGHTEVFNVPMLIEHILQQESTALFIVERLFKHFVHEQPSQTVLLELAAIFRDADYQIRPVLMALFRHPEFTSSLALSGRARLPMEWLLALLSSTGIPITKLDYEGYLDAAGQMPFIPANVAGWPVGSRWLSAAAAMARHSVCISLLEVSHRQSIIKKLALNSYPLDEILSRLTLSVVSEQTRNQLQAAIQQMPNRYDQARLLLALALASPEFALT